MLQRRFSFLSAFGRVRWTDRKLLVACLGIGFLVRLAPELLSWPLPIGFDTVYYATVMKDGVILPHWSAFFDSAWLLYALIVPVYGVFQGDPFLLLKLVGPLLFGLNVAGVYWFAKRALGWSSRLSLVAGVFFALQLASLRISWDLLRNTLGLGFLLFALTYVKEVGTKRGFGLFVGFSLLSVFAHELAGAVLIFVVLGLLAWRFMKKRFDRSSLVLALGALPSLSVFVVGMYLRAFPVRNLGPLNVIEASDVVRGQAGTLFLIDYLHVQDTVDYYSSYVGLALSVGLLFAVLFLPYLFLVVKGFFRNGILNLWTALLLVGAFGCLVVPFSALPLWHRWMFMLVYPFTFFAVNGIAKLASTTGEKRFFVSGLRALKPVAVALLLTLGLSVAYLGTPVLMNYTDSSLPSLVNISPYFSVAPAVPYQDEQNVIKSLEWLDTNMDANSCVVLQNAFLQWGRLCLDTSHSIVYFIRDLDAGIVTASDHGYSQMFFVWWNVPIGWYGIYVPDRFVSVQDFGRISVFVYEV